MRACRFILLDKAPTFADTLCMSRYYDEMLDAGRGHLLRDSDKDDGCDGDGVGPDCRTCGDVGTVTVSDLSQDAGYAVKPCPGCAAVTEDW